MGPLEGVRVLDLTWFHQGGYSTVILADLGAEIIKVERPGVGDPGRQIGRFVKDGATIVPYFIAHDRGKKSITVDLQHPEGKALIERLVPTVDVLVHNFRPGVMERLGLAYEDLRPLNPGLIYASASAYGERGPLREQPGFDIVGQARGGLMSVTGTEESGPLPAGAMVADHTGAMFLAQGITAALYHKARTGEGQALDVSLYGTVMCLQSWEINQYSITGNLPPKSGRGHQLNRGLWGSFQCADGKWLVLAGMGGERFNRFVELAGLKERLESDPALSTPEGRMRDRDRLWRVVEEGMRSRPRDEWLRLFAKHDIIVAPVQDYAEVLEDEQAWANDYLVRVEHPEAGELRIVGTPIHMSGTPAGNFALPPELGQHTEEVLLATGFTWEDLTRLREAGAI
ncbi:MAG TPA: CoA transferase [Dehalococcoidia bacterium]|nr:CoA transferase [Dehalococcoidia bacterium]